MQGRQSAYPTCGAQIEFSGHDFEWRRYSVRLSVCGPLHRGGSHEFWLLLGSGADCIAVDSSDLDRTSVHKCVVPSESELAALLLDWIRIHRGGSMLAEATDGQEWGHSVHFSWAL